MAWVLRVVWAVWTGWAGWAGWVVEALLGARLVSGHSVGAAPADGGAELLILGCSQGLQIPPVLPDLGEPQSDVPAALT